MFVSLKDWAEREKMGFSLEDTIGRIYGIGMAETKGLILPFNPPPIMGLSNTGGFEAMILSNEDNPKELPDITIAVLAEAQASELSGVTSTYSVNSPATSTSILTAKRPACSTSTWRTYSIPWAQRWGPPISTTST